MSWNDLVAMANVAVVSRLSTGQVTYRDSAGDDHTIEHAVFDDRFEQVDQTDAGKTTTGPMVGVNLDDLPEDPEATEYGDTDLRRFVVNGDEYRIHQVQRDGQGHAKCLLKKVEA